MTAPSLTHTIEGSSLLASVAYSHLATLDVTFRRGARYRYFAVPASVVRDLLAAPSAGTYFNRAIRPRFRYQRLV